MTSFEQIAALKEGRIDVGFGRIPLDDPAIERQLLRKEKLIAAVPVNHAVLGRRRPVRLADLATEPLIVYPKAPRPSYADQVLALYRDRGLRPRTKCESCKRRLDWLRRARAFVWFRHLSNACAAMM